MRDPARGSDPRRRRRQRACRAASAFRSLRFPTGRGSGRARARGRGRRPASTATSCDPTSIARAAQLPTIDDVDAARAQRISRCSPRCLRVRPMLRCWRALPRLRGGCDTARPRACGARGGGERTNAERVEREYFDLFIGLGRGELLPYGSYYLTGFLHERPLARLRADLVRLGIERSEGNIEPEDHAAILCEIMAGLAGRPLRRRRPAATASSSRSISRPGSGASSRTSSAPRRRISTAASARSGACSSISRRRLSRCRRERRDAGSRNGIKEGRAMKSERKTTVGRRDFLRALGAGAGVAAAAPRRSQRQRRPTARATTTSARRATRKPIT